MKINRPVLKGALALLATLALMPFLLILLDFFC